MGFLMMFFALFMYHPVTPTVVEKAVIITAEEHDLLARCVEAEAGNQEPEGKALVADVIINRVLDDRFPDTVTGVIYQPSQFSVVNNGSIDRVKVAESTRDIVDNEILARTSEVKVLWFNAIGYKYGTPYKKVGAHYFSY